MISAVLNNSLKKEKMFQRKHYILKTIDSRIDLYNFLNYHYSGQIARMKLIPICEVIENKSIIICEHSIVRGTQLKNYTIKKLCLYCWTGECNHLS
ncbi:MAG TPA: hypothetical protein ENH82_09400 [bacterium]|nr:hypothetical protein [bacterium]